MILIKIRMSFTTVSSTIYEAIFLKIEFGGWFLCFCYDLTFDIVLFSLCCFINYFLVFLLMVKIKVESIISGFHRAQGIPQT